jgi:hypothetical protein
MTLLRDKGFAKLDNIKYKDAGLSGRAFWRGSLLLGYWDRGFESRKAWMFVLVSLCFAVL